MAVRRTTFSESWHRVAAMRPRLRVAVRFRRQRFRGRTWHVVTDDVSGGHFRLDEGGYRVVALLDGRRSVEEAWNICNTQLGDAAPTQGEVLRLLGQLYTSNLLHAEVAPDTQQVFERFRQRRRRQFQSYLSSLWSVRLPLLDPNRWLQATAPYVDWFFRPIGLALWLVLLMTGAWQLIGRGAELARGFDPHSLLATENLALLYLGFGVIKLIHEFGHGYACVCLARRDGQPGQVHKLGVLFLVFVPTPFIDASSSWMIRNPMHRAVVGAAGMYFELAVAAVCGIVWAHTGAGHATAHALAYNMMVVAGVSTLLFNANPLLRYDGYYILSDLLGIANLAQRAQQQCWFLLRRYAFGVSDLERPAHTASEAAWLTCYWVGSAVYRTWVSLSIILYVYDRFFFIGIIMALASLAMWIVAPTARFLKYMMTSGELERVRRRARAVTFAAVGFVVLVCGIIPLPERYRAEGVIDPVRIVKLHAPVDGQIVSMLPTGTPVTPDGPPLITSTNARLTSELAETRAAMRGVLTRRELHRADDPAQVQAFTEQLEALQQRLDRLLKQESDLVIHAPFVGVWVAPETQRFLGSYIKRGENLGLVADTSRVIVRVSADQSLGPRIVPQLAGRPVVDVEIRPRRRPELLLRGRVERVIPAGQRELPSAALAAPVGGEMSVDAHDESGRRAVEPFFEVHLQPEASGVAGADGEVERPMLMHTGQRVVVRFSLPSRPLAFQAWHWLEQLLQRRKPLPENPR